MIENNSFKVFFVVVQKDLSSKSHILISGYQRYGYCITFQQKQMINSFFTIKGFKKDKEFSLKIHSTKQLIYHPDTGNLQSANTHRHTLPRPHWSCLSQSSKVSNQSYTVCHPVTGTVTTAAPPPHTPIYTLSFNHDTPPGVQSHSGDCAQPRSACGCRWVHAKRNKCLRNWHNQMFLWQPATHKWRVNTPFEEIPLTR